MNSASHPFAVKDTGVKIVVGITCCLAMLGSVFIVISYLIFKSLRSQARQILVNLSLMDFGIAMSNMTGIAANFDHYYYNNKTGEAYMDDLCVAQAFVAAFTTYSSILWTIALAVYMYLLVFQIYRYPMRYYMMGCYTLCYGLSIGLSVWLLCTERLGYAPYNSSGWCSIINNVIDYTGDLTTDYYATTVGYDLWVYLAIVMCTTVYSALFFRLKFGVSFAFKDIG